MFMRLVAFFKRRRVWTTLVVLDYAYGRFFQATVNLWQENWLIAHGAAEGPPAGMTEPLTTFFATVLVPWLSYLTGTFGLGFLVGGALFAVPDLMAAMKQWDARWADWVAARGLTQSGSRRASEQGAVEMLRQFMLTYIQALKGDLDEVHRLALAKSGEANPQLAPVFALARCAIVDAEEQKFYRYSQHFAYDNHDVDLATLQNVLLNYLVEY